MIVLKQLRVLFVIPTLKRGGAERLLINIANELQKREDFTCLIVTMYEGNDYEELTKDLNIVVSRSKVQLSVLKKNQADYKDFFDIAHEFKPHIIHSHLIEAEIFSRWKLLKNTAYFSHIHYNEKQFQNFDLNVFLKKRRLTDFYEKRFLIKKYNLCRNNFLAISRDTESYLKEVLPEAFHRRIHYLPNAIDYNAFYQERTYDNLEQSYNLITVGRFVENKNQLFLIDVVAELHKKGKNAKLTILGDGPLRPLIENRIRSKKMEAYITLCGNVSNVQHYLNESSIYMHSATYEPFGLVLLEAMAAGLPVVCLNGKGNKELVQNGKTGYILDSVSPGKFADKVIQVCEDKHLYKRISKNAQKFAEKYDIRHYIRLLVALYYDVVQNMPGIKLSNI